MKRVPLVLASTAVAGLALAGCSGSSSGSSASTAPGPVTPTALPSGVPSSVPSVSVPAGAASSASSVASQLQAAKDCLQKANLPTPTSTDPATFAQEAIRLVQDPKTRAALKQCGVNLPGL